jgi:hypothetical protein
MMYVVLALGLLWLLGGLLAVGLCLAARRIDEDIAAGRTPEPGRFARLRLAESNF